MQDTGVDVIPDRGLVVRILQNFKNDFLGSLLRLEFQFQLELLGMNAFQRVGFVIQRVVW